MIELDSPQIEPVEELGTYAKYEAGPLPAGYGVTLGNALRRVLLSSLEGAAVTSIQLRDVYQEFSTIPGREGGCHPDRPQRQEAPAQELCHPPGPAPPRQERRRRRDRRGHRRVGRRRDRQPRSDPHDPRHGRRDDRGRPDRRARSRLPLRRAVRGAADRGHRGRRDLHPGAQGELLGRARPGSARSPTTTSSPSRSRPTGRSRPEEALARSADILVRQFALFANIGMAATAAVPGVGTPPASPEHARHADRGARSADAGLQLAQAQQHRQGRPAAPAVRRRPAPDAQLRQQVARRDEGAPADARLRHPRHRAVPTRPYAFDDESEEG